MVWSHPSPTDLLVSVFELETHSVLCLLEFLLGFLKTLSKSACLKVNSELSLLLSYHLRPLLPSFSLPPAGLSEPDTGWASLAPSFPARTLAFEFWSFSYL